MLVANIVAVKTIYLTKFVSAFVFVAFAQANQLALGLTVKVECLPPNPGVYTLGWGTSRLVIPEKGKPYYTFRSEKRFVKDTLCKSGDNIGVVAFREDGTVWAYVYLRAND